MSVALYDIKEFLTLDDVAEYLADRCNYDFNLESSIDQNRLIETIVQLVRNDQLHPVFHYIGSVDWLEKKVITRKSGRFNNHEIVLTDIKYDMRVNDYYFVSDRNFNRLIENNCSNYINIINCTIEPYHVDGKQEIVENKILDYRKVKEDFSIIFYDLLYPKLDLDKLFNQADAEVIEQLREQVADLKNQLSQAKAELADKPDTIGNDKSLYVTPAIEIMNKVITEFWINYDPNQSAPKQEIIVRWITGNFDGVSKALALNIDKVYRHSEARSGGKYKR
ncbi:hypothetical protein [Psychrobacter immobilis]|uniref:hypothetical protein n=1 Tax=Psychrobacter immobilis TaxID=498 RepID=UPI00191AD86A|nr:hypothetical protein [Psychrobacter immobilis]